ncbi:MAG: YqaA family protein [Candidatus Kapaibacteriota bacterium]
MSFKSVVYKSKEWIESYALKKSALWAIFILAFAESSFFPIPPDVLLIAIAIAKPKVSIKAALWCSIGSVLGGVFGYFIGYALMESVGNNIIHFYNAQATWDKVVSIYNGEVGMWFLAGAAFTPIPYKISTIAAGATNMPLIPFILISSIGRSLRFFLVAGVIYFVGPTAKIYIDKYFDKLSIAFVVLLVLGFLAIKYLF